MATSCRFLSVLSGATASVVVNGPPNGFGGRSNGDDMNDEYGINPTPVAAAVERSGLGPLVRIGLLGIAAAALVAVAMLAFGATAAPAGTLAAGTDTGSTGSAANLNGLGGPGGPGFGGRGGPGHGFGGITITAISGSNLSLETADGWTRTITVDDGTTYSESGDEITLGDLAVGDEIAFRQTLEDDGSWTIDAIAVILPHVGGEVTAVDDSTITVEQRDGTTATITVDDDTEYQVDGDNATLADVEVGMFLVAEGAENADGSLTATDVRAADPDAFGGRGPGGRGFHFGFGPDDDAADPDATEAPGASGSAS
jgi:hypothetical protein